MVPPPPRHPSTRPIPPTAAVSRHRMRFCPIGGAIRPPSGQVGVDPLIPPEPVLRSIGAFLFPTVLKVSTPAGPAAQLACLGSAVGGSCTHQHHIEATTAGHPNNGCPTSRTGSTAGLPGMSCQPPMCLSTLHRRYDCGASEMRMPHQQGHQHSKLALDQLSAAHVAINATSKL